MKIKTAREWFETLPDSIKELAIKNAMKHNLGHDTITKTVFIDVIKKETLTDALTCSFVFSATEEGRDYWIDVLRKYDNNIDSPK